MSVYTKTMFKQNLNSRFWLQEEDGARATLELFALNDGRSTARQEQFSLLFRGDPQKIYGQRLYAMGHEAIGELELFLVPVGHDESGTVYEAVFNRLLKRAS